MTETAPLSLRQISRFFFPLMLNVQLMSFSHNIINMALARQNDAVTNLAAFAVALALHLFLASPGYQNHTIALALIRGKRSLRSVSVFVIAASSAISVMLSLIAWTSLGQIVFVQLIGVSPQLATQARSVIAILAFLPFFTGLRGLCQGIVIRARHTELVSLATLVRLFTLVIILLLAARHIPGPQLGALGLVGCIAVESLFMLWFACACGLGPAGPAKEEFGVRDTFRYSLPLAFSSAMQQVVPLLISAIISRLPDATLALAALGVIRGFIFLLAGPMRNLQQAYLALVHTRHDYRMLMRFFRLVAAGMAVIMLAVAYPLNLPVLGWGMGLETELRNYIALPLASCALFPVLYGAVNLWRGLFAQCHSTGVLGWATVAKVGYLALVWPLATLSPIPISGIALAVFLLLSCEYCEAWYLNRRRRQLNT
ncbi:hypothetical protein Pcar_0400 [Syntrophotalea carbinolica DSM 2380]|uniref:Uncharacterized protein n=1 Tax=Syntrophotalea carbinolica (strain DSM 2380 / NBRC 103641 / GraBd1) TaxID=338963 RepID=Q3A7I4_SYNC1|nr:hypothetical protein [Syntrophotalea carbinolica]ABA87660.2 hypothetical protein Pcar_0400 [Syntrophotalea carbinolica DSM 2380]